ncbi:MAG: J domain-containing protein [bacterium]|nr:J domain-containing protein [bacterium]
MILDSDILKEGEKTDEEKFQEIEDEIALQKFKEEMRVKAEKFKEGVKSILRPDPLTQSYKILGATKGESLESIKKKMIDLLLIHHPDKFNEPGAQIRANQKSQLITEAYTTIKKDFEERENKKEKTK